MAHKIIEALHHLVGLLMKLMALGRVHTISETIMRKIHLVVKPYGLCLGFTKLVK